MPNRELFLKYNFVFEDRPNSKEQSFNDINDNNKDENNDENNIINDEENTNLNIEKNLEQKKSNRTNSSINFYNSK